MRVYVVDGCCIWTNWKQERCHSGSSSLGFEFRASIIQSPFWLNTALFISCFLFRKCQVPFYATQDHRTHNSSMFVSLLFLLDFPRWLFLKFDQSTRLKPSLALLLFTLNCHDSQSRKRPSRSEKDNERVSRCMERVARNEVINDFSPYWLKDQYNAKLSVLVQPCK